jgi:hypothetical protein
LIVVVRLHRPQLPLFLLLTGCEKLSEIVRAFVRTSRMHFGQVAPARRTARATVSQQERGMAKQTRITIETDSLLILRGGPPLLAQCRQCNRETEMIPLEGVGVISNLLPSEVEAWMESEDLHRSQAPDGGQLICLNSLLKRVQKSRTV